MTEKIDHKEQALSFLHTRHDGAAAAQVYATLYLAEQQAAAVEQARIANLIALDQHEVRGGIASESRLYEKEPEETTRRAVLKPSVRKGLGL